MGSEKHMVEECKVSGLASQMLLDSHSRRYMKSSRKSSSLSWLLDSAMLSSAWRSSYM